MVVVHKFGGSTFRDLSGVRRAVAEIDPPCVLVLSAPYGVTSMIKRTLHSLSHPKIESLLSNLQQVYSKLGGVKDPAPLLQSLDELLHGALLLGVNDVLYDKILSFGERLMILIFSSELDRIGVEHQIIYPESFLLTDGSFHNATIDLEKSRFHASKLSWGDVVLVPGYYGISPDGDVNLLGGSGSDYSATSIGFIIRAEKVVIWKDVKGFMSADPRIVPSAYTVPALSYTEAEQHAIFGAQILHPMTIEPSREGNIPIEIRDIYDGTIQTIITHSNSSSSPCISSYTPITIFQGVLPSSSHVLIMEDTLSGIKSFSDGDDPLSLIYVAPVFGEILLKLLQFLKSQAISHYYYYDNSLYMIIDAHDSESMVSKIHFLFV